jgi:hypothetical protein
MNDSLHCWQSKHGRGAGMSLVAQHSPAVGTRAAQAPAHGGKQAGVDCQSDYSTPCITMWQTGTRHSDMPHLISRESSCQPGVNSRPL